jgi:hypothetical protein
MIYDTLIKEGIICCLKCNDTGYIVWVNVQTPQGIARYEIMPLDPVRDQVKAKDCIFEACTCDIGQKW